MSKSNSVAAASDAESGLRLIANLVGQKFIILPISLAYTLLILGSLSLVALAQELPSFEIGVSPVGDHAVTGQPFTYTVAVTNVGSTALANVTINIDIPDGTEFVNTRHSSLKWYGGTPFSDPNIKVDQITLFTLDDIEPEEAFVFDVIVKVLPEVDQSLVVEAISVATLEGEILASGPIINTPVREPTSTPRPTLPPLPTPTGTPAATPTLPAPSAGSGVGDLASPTSPAVADVPSEHSGGPEAAASPGNPLGYSVWSIAILAIIGVILVLIVVGIGWFVKRK